MTCFSPPGGMTRQVQQGQQFPRQPKYLQLFQDAPNICWLLSHDHSGERPAASHTGGITRQVQQSQQSPRCLKHLCCFQDIAGVCCCFAACHCVEQCQSFPEHSSFAQSDRRLLSYDRFSECPPCLHQEASRDKSDKAGGFQDVSNTCICLQLKCLLVVEL